MDNYHLIIDIEIIDIMKDLIILILPWSVKFFICQRLIIFIISFNLLIICLICYNNSLVQSLTNYRNNIHLKFLFPVLAALCLMVYYWNVCFYLTNTLRIYLYLFSSHYILQIVQLLQTFF